jgi:hypothetical protein
VDRRIRICAWCGVRGLARLSHPRRGARGQPHREVLLNAVCIIVAGVVRTSLPATEFTLAWEHSVAKTRWEERYDSDGAKLRLKEARIQGFGAGMEPPSDARLVGGWWTWRPALEPLAELRLTHSSYARDYRVCWSGHCRPLSELTGPAGEGEVVTLSPCAR